MVRPVGLIEDTDSQNQVVNSALDQMKDFALSLGEKTESIRQKQIDTQAFYELVMKRGRE